MRDGEFGLIARIRERADAARADVVVGIGDDAAVLRPAAGRLLVVAMDTLNAGVHFPDGTAPADIGWKALAVNLSDLAATGAEPAWCTLSLSLPQSDAGWIDAFLDGFLALAQQHAVALVGGDTTRGPLSVCVTAHGFVDPGRMLRRDGARAGDDIWVTGTLGDAAAALAQWRGSSSSAGLAEHDNDVLALRGRLDRPTPRVAIGLALAGIASACIDLSDGLFADLGHVCAASGIGGVVDIDALPASQALLAGFDLETRRRLQAGGGDDYELCFTAASVASVRIAEIAIATGVRITRIGSMVAGERGARGHFADGTAWSPPHAGYDHFAAD
jgi:thiamine-monophosphate kinase